MASTLVTDRLVRVLASQRAAGSTFYIVPSAPVPGGPGFGLPTEILPEGFGVGVHPYEDVSIVDALWVQVNYTADVSIPVPSFAIPIRIEKIAAGGTWAIAVTNDAAADDSPELEIYIGFH